MDPEHDDSSVTSTLRALARHDHENMASGRHVESTLRAYVRARAAARSTRRRYALLATAVALVGLVSVSIQRSPVPIPSTITQVSFRAAVPDEVTTEFFPLVHGNVPLTDGQLVRIEVPRAALSAFGLGSESQALAVGTVLADVIVGEDGLARAVRFVRSATD
jgi:hypothetical protein